jgi:hypothetical protein
MPLCDGFVPPHSRDPVYPGVIVSVYAGCVVSAWNSPNLFVSTGTNLRNGSDPLCGGFVMLTRKWDQRCFRGIWLLGGEMQVGGGGDFHLCPQP